MYRLTKRFTSRDGHLEVDNREYGITQEGLDELGNAKPHLGGATHIFVRMDGGPSNMARFFTRNESLSFVRAEKPETGWADFQLDHGSGYVPERGEVGWWNVEVDGAESETAEGIGLPNSWHVSTFLIFSWDESSQPEIPDGGPSVPEQPSPNPKTLRLEFSISTEGYAAHVRLYIDGTYEMDEIR